MVRRQVFARAHVFSAELVASVEARPSDIVRDLYAPLVDEGARLEERTGKLTWELDLKPGESRTLSFSYEVKFPTGTSVALE